MTVLPARAGRACGRQRNAPQRARAPRRPRVTLACAESPASRFSERARALDRSWPRVAPPPRIPDRPAEVYDSLSRSRYSRPTLTSDRRHGLMHKGGARAPSGRPRDNIEK